MQAQAALARTLALCTAPASYSPEIRLWLRRPAVLAWLIRCISAKSASDDAAGNAALCLGNLVPDPGAEDGRGILAALRQAGAVKALVGEECFHALMHLPMAVNGSCLIPLADLAPRRSYCCEPGAYIVLLQ